MKIVQGIFYFLLIMVVALLLAALVAPQSKMVSRSILIAKSPNIVFNEIARFEQWENWDPWYAASPTHRRTYSGGPDETYQTFTWRSDSKGAGKVTQSALKTNEYLEFMLQTEGIESTGIFTLEESGKNTKVTWSLTSDMRYPHRLLNYFMERSISPQLENGLMSMKQHVEKLSDEVNTGNHTVVKVPIHGNEHAVVQIPKSEGTKVKSGLKDVYLYIQSNGLVPKGPSRALVYLDEFADSVLSISAATPLEKINLATGDSISTPLGTAELGKNHLLIQHSGYIESAIVTSRKIIKWVNSEGREVKYPIVLEYIAGEIPEGAGAAQKINIRLYLE